MFGSSEFLICFGYDTNSYTKLDSVGSSRGGSGGTPARRCLPQDRPPRLAAARAATGSPVGREEGGGGALTPPLLALSWRLPSVAAATAFSRRLAAGPLWNNRIRAPAHRICPPGGLAAARARALHLCSGGRRCGASLV